MDIPTLSDTSTVEDRPRLVMESGPQPGLIVLLTQDWHSLGRSADNDIVLRDLEVSRHHARLRRSGQGWLLEDLGSTNGTYINGGRLTASHVLRHGDVINLSEEITFIFRHRPLAPTQAIPPFTRRQRGDVAAWPDSPADAMGSYAEGPVRPTVAGPGYTAAPDRSRQPDAGKAGLGEISDQTAEVSSQRSRRPGQNAWALAGIAAGLIIAGFLCLAVLAYLTLPELGGTLLPGVTIVPGGATMTPAVGFSTSVPPIVTPTP